MTLPYGTRECRGHWHVVAYGEDLYIPSLGNELDAGTAWSESARRNIEWLQAELAEARKDTRRLEWLEKEGAVDWSYFEEFQFNAGLRWHIDKAMDPTPIEQENGE